MSDKLSNNAVACATLAQVRAQIDLIDQRLLDLLAQRWGYVRQAAGFKTMETIIDRQRIESIVASMRRRADRAGLDADLTEAVWRRMIDGFIRLEEQLLENRQKPPVQTMKTLKPMKKSGAE